MRVFVTGGSGHVGSAVVPELLAAGHEVVALARFGRSGPHRDGTIAGVSPTFTSTTPHRFAVLVPEALLHRGAHRARLFEVEHSPAGTTLHPIRST